MLVPAYGIVVAAVVTVASELLILAGSVLASCAATSASSRCPGRSCPAVAAAAAMAGLLRLVARALPLPRARRAGAGAYGRVLAAISPASRRLLEGLRP